MKQQTPSPFATIVTDLTLTALEGLVGALVGLALVHLTHAVGWHDQGTEVTLMAVTFVMVARVDIRVTGVLAALRRHEEKS